MPQQQVAPAARAPRSAEHSPVQVRSVATEPRPVAPDFAEMMARYLGGRVMQAFADEDVTELYVNPQDGAVRVETRRLGKLDTRCRLPRERVEMFLNAVAASHGGRLDAAHPSIQAELPQARFGGARLQGFVEPITQGPCFTIRKPPAVVYPLDSYVQQGRLPVAWRLALSEAIRTRQSILVVGGTNTGKTTLANALLREIGTARPTDRVVILEDTVELQCAASDHLALRTTADVTLRDLVKQALRTNPTRIVVGEVRDAAALDLLDAWATGHPGGIATLHATTVQGALLRLDRLAQRAGVPSQRALIAEAVQLVVLLQNTNVQGAAARRVTDLVGVTGLTEDGRYDLHRCTERGTWEAV
jgi:type IV secretion system protein VirB11